MGEIKTVNYSDFRGVAARRRAVVRRRDSFTSNATRPYLTSPS